MQRRYKRSPGFSGQHGEAFEYKLCALIFARATNLKVKFSLASNMDGLGVFDDIVLQISDIGSSKGKKYLFLQLKHKEKSNITTNRLLSESGAFSLFKLHNSYLTAREQFYSNSDVNMFDGSFEECLFALYTNTDVEKELKIGAQRKTDDEKYLSTGGYTLQFNEETHPQIFDNLKNLPNIREFFSQFIIMYKQAKESELDGQIKSELLTKFDIFEENIHFAFTTYREYVQQWWKKSNKFLYGYWNEKNPLKRTRDHVISTLVTKLLEYRKKDLDNLNIRFKDSAIKEMKNFLNENTSVVIFASGRSTTLSAAKIHQILSDGSKFTIMGLKDFYRYKSEVMLAWKNNKFNTLVLEGSSACKDLNCTYTEIFERVIQKGYEKKFIFLSRKGGNVEQIKEIRDIFRSYLRETSDTWKISDMLEQTRELLMEKEVKFQGRDMRLSSLVSMSDIHLLEHLDSESISLLLANERPKIGRSLQDTLDYYIERTLESKNFVDNDIFKETDITFGLSGERLENLKSVIPFGEEISHISGWRANESCRFILIESPEDYLELCRRSKNVYWLSKENRRFLCKKSNDNSGAIEQYLDKRNSKQWIPNILLEDEDRVVLVTADPGMGKSTLLTHLAQRTKEIYPEIWIVRININEHTRTLDNIKNNEFHEEDAIKLLSMAAGVDVSDRCNIETELIDHNYMHSGNMVLLVDGVDEVIPFYLKEVFCILRFFHSTKIKKLWITSRPLIKKELERNFQCFSYSLIPFSEYNQKCFLVQFWKKLCSNLDNNILETIADHVILLANRQLNKNETTFMGIPLQSLLLAELLVENLKNNSTWEQFMQQRNINILKLYDLYVKKKWDIYLLEKKCSDQTNVNVITDNKLLYGSFIANHKMSALITLMSKEELQKLHDKNIENKTKDFLEKVNDGVEKTGVITGIINGRPLFQHRTLAEYFAAKWFHEYRCFNRAFLQDHILEERFEVVKSVLDRMLAGNNMLHNAVLNGDVSETKTILRTVKSVNEKDCGGRTVLHLSVSYRLTDMTRLLLDHDADVNDIDTLLRWTPIQYAVKGANWEILAEIMEKKQSTRQQILNDVQYITPILRVATRNGYTNLVTYLLENRFDANFVFHEDKSTLLHEAARGDQIRLFRTLIDRGARSDVLDGNGKRAIHIAAQSGSIKVTQFLIERLKDGITLHENGQQDSEYCSLCHSLLFNECDGIRTFEKTIKKIERLECRDEDGNTPLHLAAERGNIKVVQYLLQSGSNLRSKNIRNETPLILASRFGHLAIVKLLLESGYDFNCEVEVTALTAACEYGHKETVRLLLVYGARLETYEEEKPLHVASRLGHEKVVQILIEYGAIVYCRTSNGDTPLHLASAAGQLDIVKYLLELQVVSVNVVNYRDEMPLHVSARNGKEHIVQYLIEMGSYVEAKDKCQETALHFACGYGQYGSAKYLITKGANINAINTAGETPLYLASRNCHTEIVKLLLQNSADLSTCANDGTTALIAAGEKGHVEIVRIVLEYGGNIQDSDLHGNTILHLACIHGSMEILKILSKLRVNFDVTNCSGETSLLRAVQEGNNVIVKYLANNNANISIQNSSGETPLDIAFQNGNQELTSFLLDRSATFNINLHMASSAGNLSVVRYLTEHGALVNEQNDTNATPILCAVKSGHFDITCYLVEKGARLDVCDEMGCTPLHIATRGGFIDIVKFLMKKYSLVDARNSRHETALHIACEQGCEEIVRLLIEQGAGSSLRNANGKSPLDIAMEKSHVSLVSFLMKCTDKTLTIRSFESSVLHRAVECSDLEKVKQWVQAGVPLDCRNHFGRTPLWVATSKGNLSIVKYLLESSSDVNIYDCNGTSPLDVAVQLKHLKILEELVKGGGRITSEATSSLQFQLYDASFKGNANLVKRLLRFVFIVDFKIENDWTPLQRAASENHLDVVRLLLIGGANVDMKTTGGVTALSKAVYHGHSEMVKLLLSCGANVNITSNFGETPLHWAGKEGHVSIVKTLVENSANTEVCNKDGDTPLHWAAKKGHFAVVKILVQSSTNIAVRNKDGYTPLCLADECGHGLISQYLRNASALK